MRRKQARGTPLIEAARAALPADRRHLDELVKGSLDYTMAMIRSAFYRAFRGLHDNYAMEDYLYIEEVFADHLIVKHSKLPPDEYYYVAFQPDGEGSYTFTPRDQWEVVELTYRIQATESAQRRQSVQRDAAAVDLTEEIQIVDLGEADRKTGARKIRGYGITAEVVNANGRRYRRPVLEAALNEARQRKNELGARAVLGEDQHPSDKGQRPAFLETIVRWDDWLIESDGRVAVEGIIVPTSKGRDAITLMEHKVFPGLSQRAWGYAERITLNGEPVDDITELHISGYDLVLEPSDPNGVVAVLESRRHPAASAHSPKEAPTVEENELTLDALKAKYPDRVREILAEADAARRDAEHKKLQEQAKADAIREEARREALEEARKQHAAELAKVQAEKQALEEAEQKRLVADHIAKTVGAIESYDENVRTNLIADVQADNPKTIEEADAVLKRRRATIDALLAGKTLEDQGRRPSGTGRIEAAPVIERATGQPAFARVSIELNEQMRRRGLGAPARQANAPQNRADVLAESMLRRFDTMYGRQLQAEAELFEANTTGDFNIPYSVSRAIIAQAVPQLVAAQVFDVDTIDTNPTLVFYESFAYETGGQPTVTAETVSAVLNGWANLANKRVNVGSVTVTNAAADVTYVEGTDYVIDYSNGRIRAIATITNAQSIRVTYTYQAMRKGENVGIERGKAQLDHVTLTCAADRLATDITREAVLFSQSQQGYDAVTRSIQMLMERIMRKIDGDLFLAGLEQSLLVANNSGGTWTAASETLAKLVGHIGAAKVKVQNRFYEPTGIVMSVTNHDRLTNPENNFHIFGVNGVGRDAAGMLTVKGLPVYGTTNFRDDYVLVVHRELVQHRVYQPLTIFGPYPAYDSNGLLKANEQYYVEEFNGRVTPIPQKGAYVKIA
jgi:hypothetical protein